MDLLKRITNLRFTAFLIVCLEAGALAWADKLDSGDLQMVLIAAIAAFIGAQAWESTKINNTGA
jgi:hypothetical protein